MYKIKEITFGYGKKNISIKVPESSIISMPHINHLDKLENELKYLKSSLRNPIGCTSLSELAQGEKMLL